MLNIFKSLKKIAGFEKHENPITNNESKSQKIDRFFHKISSFISILINDFHIIREKSKNLSKTNYELGLKHLNKGNINEAIFRFRLTKKFFPENYDAYYQLFYCYIIQKEYEKAREISSELLEKAPHYQDKVSKDLELL